jgi:pseudouridine synthase
MNSERTTADHGERLQKFLARAGLGARRKCEELIAEGRVRVNGRVVTEPGVRVVPGRDAVLVDGVAVKPEKALYLVFNKPKNCLCTREQQGTRGSAGATERTGHDNVPREGPSRRGKAKTVFDFLPGIAQKIYTVGRLDYDAEGLLLLTNDGDFAQRVIHPRHGMAKTYVVEVRGRFTEKAAEALRRGVRLDGKLIEALKVKLLSSGEQSSRLEIEVSQGINRQVKRMLGRVGYEVTAIRRTRIGEVVLGSLPTGKFRRMTEAEIRSFDTDKGG